MKKEEVLHIDLTHLIENAMDVFPGGWSLELENIKSVAVDGFANSVVTMSMHVGTHMDGPAHMIDGGKSLYEFGVERFFGYCDIVDASSNQGVIGVEVLTQLPKLKSKFLLIRTDHSLRFGKPSYYGDYPVLSEELAHRIVELGYELIGLDTPSPDVEPYSIHQILLSKNILIVENLRKLALIPANKQVFLSALPLKMKSDSSPIRAVVTVS